MATRKTSSQQKRSLTRKEFHRALITMDDLIQNDNSPKKSGGRINRNKLVKALKEEGVVLYIANALIEQLIEEKVLRRGKKFVRIYNYTPLVGEQITHTTPNEYLHLTESSWNTYISKHMRNFRAASTRTKRKKRIGSLPSGKEKRPRGISPSGALKLFGPNEHPIIHGLPQAKLTIPRYDVLLSLCTAGEKGLTKDMLVVSSKHSDARGILKRLRESDPEWSSVIKFPERRGIRYRVV
jgi:hypothetical protein